MSREPERIEFHEDDLAAVVARMRSLADAGAGWINVDPGVDETDAPPPRSPLAALVSGRGPALPHCTWVPARRRARRPEPTMLGVEHGTGPRAVERLRSFGAEPPAGWRVLQDHSRRGLLVAVPGDAGHERVLRWLLAAGAALCDVPLTGWWLATVYDEPT